MTLGCGLKMVTPALEKKWRATSSGATSSGLPPAGYLREQHGLSQRKAAGLVEMRPKCCAEVQAFRRWRTQARLQELAEQRPPLQLPLTFMYCFTPRGSQD